MSTNAGPPSTVGAPALTAAELAEVVGGSVIGDSARCITGVAPLDRAGPEHLSFLADQRYAPLFSRTRAGIVLVPPRVAEGPPGVVRVVVEKPYDALFRVLPRLYRMPPRPVGIHPTAVIAPTARIGEGVAIEACAVIGDGAVVGSGSWIGPMVSIADGVEIGRDCRLHAHVSCYAGARLGDRVVLHSGVRVASDGFGYAFGDGAHNKLLHVGSCIINDDVEIGANSTIDRGSIDDTVIGAGTKIDNLVHIAHNVRVGRLCLIMAQAGIAGSARIGDGAIVAGQAGIAHHATVGAGARIGGQSGVFSDVPEGETWSGYPARPHRESLRALAATFRLSQIIKRIERLLEREP